MSSTRPLIVATIVLCLTIISRLDVNLIMDVIVKEDIASILMNADAPFEAGTQSRLLSVHDAIPNRMLIGIFTTDTSKEAARRQLIRNSYLSMYKYFEKAGLQEGQTNRICALQDLLKDEDRGGSSIKDCSLIYTFVMGGLDASKTTAPTDRTTLSRDSNAASYTLDRSSSSSNDPEHDVVYLNIRENMNQGKSATWFQYASKILPVERLRIDLIAKIDSDAVLFPRALQYEVNAQVLSSRPAKGIYGGLEQVDRGDGDVVYMQGGVYFMSTDIAQHITSGACPRSEIVQHMVTDRGFERAEDREMGHFVEACWNGPYRQPSEQDQGAHLRGKSHQNSQPPTIPLTTIVLSGNGGGHANFYKDTNNFRVFWKEGLSQDIGSLRYQEVLRTDGYQSNEGCPPTEQSRLEDLAWFDQRTNLKRAKTRFEKLLASSCPTRTTSDHY